MIPLLGGYAWVNTVGSEKCRKRASSASEFKSETKCPRCKRYLQNESRRAYLQKFTSDFLFLFQDLVMIFQSLVVFLPVFSTLKGHNLVLGGWDKK